MLRKLLGLGSLLALVSVDASAIDTFNPGDLSAVVSDTVTTVIKTVGIGSQHRAYQPASAMGLSGIDLGLDITAIAVPDEFKTAMALVVNQSASSIPAVLPLPRLNLHKGLPGKVDVGFSWAAYENVFRTYGGDVKWNFLTLPAGPALGARVSGSSTTLWFLKTQNYTFDVIASKGLALIEPYAGAGVVTWSGDLDLPPEISATLPVSGHASGTTGHVFAGLPLKLLLVHLTAEYDYSLAGVSTYGAKISLAF